jgi:hypothetical protein
MANEMQKSKISRILNVWLEREVYSTEFIQSLKGVTNNTQTVVHQIPVIDHKAVKSPGGASASGPGNLQTVILCCFCCSKFFLKRIIRWLNFTLNLNENLSMMLWCRLKPKIVLGIFWGMQILRV